jgi:hypothetical protein
MEILSGMRNGARKFGMLVFKEVVWGGGRRHVGFETAVGEFAQNDRLAFVKICSEKPRPLGPFTAGSVSTRAMRHWGRNGSLGIDGKVDRDVVDILDEDGLLNIRRARLEYGHPPVVHQVRLVSGSASLHCCSCLTIESLVSYRRSG